MKDEYFKYLISMLRENVGWSLEQKDISLLGNKLDNILRKNMIPNYNSLIEEVKKSSKPYFWKFIESLASTNTSFYRNYKVFKGFEDVLLPYLLETNNATKKIKILSIGCSTGQELYSLAISIKKILNKEYGKWNIELLGIDISSDSIVKAQKGYYTEFEIQQGLNAEDILENFKYTGTHWQANQELVNMVQFRRFNIYKDDLGKDKYDFILCRNVLSAFYADIKLGLLEKIYNQQVNEGFLCFGLGENTEFLDRFYNPVSDLECVYKAKKISDKEYKPKSTVEKEMPNFERPDSFKMMNQTNNK